MHTFEITVQHKRQGEEHWPVVVEYSDSELLTSVRNKGCFQLDPNELSEADGDIKKYGTLLGQALFRDFEIRDAFIGACRQSSPHSLHVLLSIEDDELRHLRWERLCAPLDGTWGLLTLDERVPFALHLSSRVPRRFPPIRRQDLRALIVAASPVNLDKYNLAAFDVQDAVYGVRTALGEEISPVILATETVEGSVGLPTLDILCEQIATKSCAFLHIICHGQYSRKRNDGALFLATEDNQVDVITSSRLLRRLRRITKLPHVIFLASCESASPEAERVFGGLAQKLVRELGVPAVVAMTEQVSIVTAQALAEGFYRRLIEHGKVDQARVEACIPLAERYDVTVPALFSCMRGRSLFSETLDQHLKDTEVTFGLDRLGPLLKERAPVLLPAFKIQESILREGQQKISVETFDEALAEVTAISEETLDNMSFRALAQGETPQEYDSRCPFRGLSPFLAKDREFFFGREDLIKRLQERLADYPFLAVLGPSGSGKSSLVLAGLIPALQDQEPGLGLVTLRPGSIPLAQLEAELATMKWTSFVLVVDQFEELFTLCSDDSERRAFIKRLFAFPKNQRVILTMRADFWGECAPYPMLKEAMQVHQELIAPMDMIELRSAMEQQASAVKLYFEAGLIATILDDVRGEPGAMPLLQHALKELWERRHGRWLRNGEYQAIGGVQQAIAHTANTVYDALSPKERDRVRDIFVRLTRLDDAVGLGGERRDTRQRVGLEDLVPAGGSLREIHTLVNQLADKRLVVTGRNPITDREEVEVAHEALIRAWPKLQEWLREGRDIYQLRRRIHQDALEWEEQDHDESYLIPEGKRLEEASALLTHPRVTLNERERTYIEESVLQGRLWVADVHIEAKGSTVDISLEQPGDRTNGKDTLIQAELKIDPFALRELEDNRIAYGELLREGFSSDPPIQSILTQARNSALNANEPLCLRFAIAPDYQELHVITWEALYTPNENENEDEPLLVVSRISSDQDVRPRSLRSLRALVVTAGPDTSRTLEQIRATLAPIPVAEADSHLLDRIWDDYGILYLACPVRFDDGKVWLGESSQGISGQALLSELRMVLKRPHIVVVESLPYIRDTNEDLDNDRAALATLAQQLSQVGVPAVVMLPTNVTPQIRDDILTVFFRELQQDGQIDRAVAVAQSRVSDRSSWLPPIIYTSARNSNLWYEPGFGGDRRGKRERIARESLIRGIKRGRCVPILGPGTVEPWFGSSRKIAWQWAKAHSLTMSSPQPSSLPQVAQYLATRYGMDFLHNEYVDALKAEFIARLPERLRPKERDYDTLTELVQVSGWPNVVADTNNEIHQILASLDLSLYITTTPDSLMFEALRAQGKKPVREICRWNVSLDRLPSLFEDNNYAPTPEAPLVYHLFGSDEEVGSLLFTDDDYFECVIRISAERDRVPHGIWQALSSSTLLLLGHHMDQRSIQILLRGFISRIDNRFRFKHTIQLEANTISNMRDQEMYLQDYDMNVYWGSVEDFVRELQHHWEEQAA